MVMFWVLGLIIVAAVVLVVGLFYFMNKDEGNLNQQQVVPITDISQLKPQEVSVIEKSNVDEDLSEKDELLKAKARLADLEGDVQQQPKEEAKRDTEQDGHLEQRLEELENELHLKGSQSLLQNEEYIKSTEVLEKENKDLKDFKNSISVYLGTSENIEQALRELKENKNLLEQQLELNVSRAAQLESQINSVKKEMGQQLLEANATIARLKFETENQNQSGMETLLKEKKELEERREQMNREYRQMQEEFVASKEELLVLKDARKLLEAKLAIQEEDFKQELQQAKDVVAHLTQQKELQDQNIQRQEQDIAKLKELNDTLIDKAKVLSYELNRHRSQAAGLEQVCGNFKSQMEELFGQVEKAKRDNSRLARERSDLELGLASLQSENSKLLERDRNVQKELEKNKEQLSRFEKVYDSFKSDVNDLSKPKPKQN